MPAQLAASFRDPAGYVYRQDGRLVRRVNPVGLASYRALMDSGLYDEITNSGLLVPHREFESNEAIGSGGLTIIPFEVPFVSYPYEWCFSQLKAAALLTLEIQARAIGRGLILKDASAYNVQFLGTRATFIDTLSFEPYEEGQPWGAYRQFCQHFLAPLLLMASVDVRLGGLLRNHIDGIPLDLAGNLLPKASYLRPGVLLHIHLHARSLHRHRYTALRSLEKVPRVTRTGLLALLDSLRGLIDVLKWEPEGTEWADYVNTHGYSNRAEAAKAETVRKYVAEIRPGLVWDLGANVGTYSRIAAESNAKVVAFDIDPAAVEKCFLDASRSENRDRILPLILDLSNPSPGVGWANRERSSWIDRKNADAVMALALIHHLAIGNNLPLGAIARLFDSIAPFLIIEFVPKEDPQVQRLLGSRADIFTDYTREHFEAEFERYFDVSYSQPIVDTPRTLYLMRRKRLA